MPAVFCTKMAGTNSGLSGCAQAAFRRVLCGPHLEMALAALAIRTARARRRALLNPSSPAVPIAKCAHGCAKSSFG